MPAHRSQPGGQAVSRRPGRGAAAKRVQTLEISVTTERLMRKLLAVAQPYATRRPTSGVDKRGWLWLEVHGQGRRGRRPPARTDDHLVIVKLSSGFLQLEYERRGRWVESRSIFAPTEAHVAVCDAFLARHLVRIRK
jgi:hypothetical protein